MKGYGKKGKVTVPVNLKSQDIANDILKDTGLPKAF
jgi:hypothetical protein